MGVSYITFPLAKVIDDPKGLSWLEDEGILLPTPLAPSHDATLGEILLALDQLTGYSTQATYHAKGCDITVINQSEPKTGYEAVLWLTPIEKDQNLVSKEAADIYFHRGKQEVLVKIVQALVPLCGPYILYRTSGGAIAILSETIIEGSNW